MKISILSPDLSHNCLGRAYLLAKILQRYFDVEIAGPTLGNGIWEPLAHDNSIKYKSFPGINGSTTYKDIKKFSETIDGDCIYASKPLATSFGMGLILKLSKGKKLVLDIDDWQWGMCKEVYRKINDINKKYKYIRNSITEFFSTTSIMNPLLMEKLYFIADGITVSNRFLLERFGGEIIWHARDTDLFDPAKYDREAIRDRHGCQKRRVIMFFGTPHPHKGVEDLIYAVDRIKTPDILLVLVGLRNTGYSKDLKRLGEKTLSGNFRAVGVQPFGTVPEFLAMSDVVVIPQRNTFATIGQFPVKILDALSMGKPVVSTQVSDIPEIIGDCGWIVEPGNPDKLAQTIQYVLDHPFEAAERGIRARKKCIENFSYKAVGEKLNLIFMKYKKPEV